MEEYGRRELAKHRPRPALFSLPIRTHQTVPPAYVSATTQGWQCDAEHLLSVEDLEKDKVSTVFRKAPSSH